MFSFYPVKNTYSWPIYWDYSGPKGDHAYGGPNLRVTGPNGLAISIYPAC